MKNSLLPRLWAKCYTKAVVKLHRQTTPKGLSYLVQRHEGADMLVVSFPGCTRPAHFNYVSTLRSLSCHRLFLLDDFAANGLGNYLMRPDVSGEVISLIRQMVRELHVSRLVFVGSSKGASSALFFGFQFPEVTLCIAAPQYFLGDYLWDGIEYRENLADMLEGEPTPEGISALNVKLRNLIEQSSLVPQRIYLHYSDSEHTYPEHVRPLLDDLHHRGVEVDEDVAHYPNHSDLRYYYPAYLRQIVKELI